VYGRRSAGIAVYDVPADGQLLTPNEPSEPTVGLPAASPANSVALTSPPGPSGGSAPPGAAPLAPGGGIRVY
jgi:hypothetical protein